MNPRRSALLLLLMAACATPPPPEPEPVAPLPPPVVPPLQRRGGTTVAPGQPQVTKLDNGMAVITSSSAPGRDAILQFGMLAGTLMMAPGLGELTTQALVDSADASQGRSQLQLAIARLGGSLKVEPGPVSTWIDIRVPGNRWREALAALRAALDTANRSRNQIERIRDSLVAARTAAIQANPVGEMAHRLMLGDVDTATHLNDLLDRDASEVDMYASRLFRPERTLLVIEAPESHERLQAALRTGPDAISGWRPSAPMSGDVPLLSRRFEPGIHWAPDDGTGPCQVAMIMMLPDLAQIEAAPLFVLQECITLDGTGGRLEQLQNENGLGHLRWRSEILQTPDAMALVLHTRATPTEALALYRVLSIARSSLRDVLPTRSELTLGLRRAPLTARLGMLDLGARVRSRAQLMVRATGMERLELGLRAVERADFDLGPAIEKYLELPVAMVCVGGKVPNDAPDIHRFASLPAGLGGPLATKTSAPNPAGSADADPWLDRAVSALGSRTAMADLAGWTSEARIQHREAPPMLERIDWTDTGDLLRSRELLGRVIETRIEGERSEELLAPDRRSLDRTEVAVLRREQQRHPLGLLAAHVRGELKFRPVAQRTVGDRELMVLEAIGPRFDRLRVHIDAQSHLIRVVESWETLSDGSIVHLEDAWSDYRRSGGLRVPYHRMTTFDNGQNRVEAVFKSWLPKQRQR